MAIGQIPPDNIHEFILGDQLKFTSDAVIAEVKDLTGQEVKRLWRAFGFPDSVGEAAFTTADVAALGLIGKVLDSGNLDFETVIKMTRAVGQTMARLAEWEVSTLVSRVEELEAGKTATGSRAATGLRLFEQVGEGFEELLIYSWRRHLAAAVARVENLGANEENLHVSEQTVGFADLVGFSEHSNTLNEDEIGELVEEFESRCMDTVADRGGRVIKTLGDSVLFVTDSAARAFEVSEEILHQIAESEVLPDVRIGLASGPVVSRLGDVFGPPVNLAARMTTVARRNRIIVDSRTADLLPKHEFEIRKLPMRPVRGFGDIEPVAVRRRMSR